MKDYKCSHCKDRKALFDQNGQYVMECSRCVDIYSERESLIDRPSWTYEPKRKNKHLDEDHVHKRKDEGDTIIESIGYAILFGII